jgi:hypothetical protein
MKVGFGMNIICVAINIAWLQTFGIYYFDLNEFPDWAKKKLSG